MESRELTTVNPRSHAPCTETSGEDRTGAIEAIDERLDTVSDGGSDDAADEDGERDAESADDTGTTGGGASNSGFSIVDVRNQVRSVAADLIGRPLDGITEVRADDGWHTTVEVIERNSIPDTQDILKLYEIDLNDNGNVTGYRRLCRYRRDDTDNDSLE